jgi:peptidoglycan/LPS O-acetylase OafA/YrhL
VVQEAPVRGRHHVEVRDSHGKLDIAEMEPSQCRAPILPQVGKQTFAPRPSARAKLSTPSPACTRSGSTRPAFCTYPRPPAEFAASWGIFSKPRNLRIGGAFTFGLSWCQVLLWETPLKLSPRIDALTGLRGLAAFAVVVFHLCSTPLMPPELPGALPATASFYMGVDLFFLLSGFVLMHVHGSDFAVICSNQVWRFYSLRLARIYPVHFSILVVLVVGVAAQSLLSTAGMALQSPERFPIDGLAKHLLLLGWSSPTWNPPAWSLSAEWVAYLAFPLVASLVVRLSLPATITVLVLAAGGFAVVYATLFDFLLDRHGLLRVAFEFPMGCLLYCIARRLPPWTPMPLLIAAAGFAWALFGTRWGDLAVVPLLGAIILACAGRNTVSRVLSAGWIVWLGEISYSVYMVHVLILGLLGRVAARAFPHAGTVVQPALLVLAAGVVVVAAAILHHLVERPARQYFRNWIKLQPVGAV